MSPVLKRRIVFVHMLSPFCDMAFDFAGCLNSFTCTEIERNILYLRWKQDSSLKMSTKDTRYT